MKSSPKKLNSNQIELTVELESVELKRFIDKTESQFSRELEIDGFRKGKVPKELVKKHVDPQAILSSTLDLAMRESLADAVEEGGWDVLNVSGLDIKENTAERLQYSVLLTLFPDIKITDLNFKVKKKEVAIEQKEIDTTIESIRISRAKLVPKEGPAENGDRVEVDFEVKSEGQVIEGGISKNHPLILGKKGFIPGFEDNIVGMLPKEAKDFSVVAPTDYFHKPVAGKKLDIHVEVQDVKKVELPDLNDEFAKSLGRFEDMGQLTANIKEGLMEEKREKEKQRVRLEILNTLVEKSDITAPENMVQEQLERMVGDFDADLHRSGMELGPYLAHIGKTVDDLKKDWRERAEQQVKVILVIHKVGRDRQISATPEELEPAINEAMQGAMFRGEIQKGNLDVEKLKDAIATQIIQEKTLQFLEEYCSA